LTVDEDSRVVARSPDLQGVVTDGKDKNEAVNNAFEAIDSVLESLGLEKEYSLIITHESSV
jgi:predicted RNase H-like HicB family nuclease